MNKIETLSLITGVFTDEEAKEVLMNIYLTKIQFQEMNNFSFQERFGKQDQKSITRISELKVEIKKMLSIISEAKVQNKNLVIFSEINLQLLDNNVAN